MSEKNNYIFLTISNQKKKLIGKISQSDKTLIQPKKTNIVLQIFFKSSPSLTISSIFLAPWKAKGCKKQ